MNMVMWMCFAFLSAAGSFFLMAAVWLQPKTSPKTSPSPVQLIFYLSFCDFFLSINNGVGYALRLMNGGNPLDGFWCSVTFFIEHMAVSTQILWYSMIAFNILLILFGWKESHLQKIQIYQHICIWGYALVTTLPPLIRKKYGPLQASAYCYFPSPSDPRRLMIYVPVALGVLFALGVFIYAVYFFFVRRGTLKGAYILFRLGFLVVIFTVTWGSAAGGRLYDALGEIDQSNLQLVANTLSGFSNFVVWTLTSRQTVTWVSVQLSGEESQAHPQTHEETWHTIWTSTENFEENGTAAADVEAELESGISTKFSINAPDLPISTSFRRFSDAGDEIEPHS